ncbi:MAG: hypothetical protein ACOVOV_10090, partial [Dolichospermum sp.]
TGNVLINTTTDAGYKLDVNGSTRVKGAGTTSATTAFVVQNSLSSTTFSVRDDGLVIIPGTTYLQGFTQIGGVQFYPVLDGGYTTSSTGRALRVDTSFNNTVSSTYAYQFGAFSLETGTASNINGTSIISTLAPTSGSKTFITLNVGSTINATGTYSGIVRGILYNPILTSMTGVNHRAIETVTGNVIFGSTSGNVLIGTTTDAGYKLDVNGTARIQGNTTITGSATNSLLVKGSGTTSSTNAFVVQNSAGSTFLTITDDGVFKWGVNNNSFWLNSGTTFFNANGTTSYFQPSSAGFRFYNVQTGIFGYSGNTIAQSYFKLIADTFVLGINSTINNSAQVQFDSTTKGFLQPRMTNGQVLAISTPATGLQAYDTTNNKNLLYNGTAWQNIATES